MTPPSLAYALDLSYAVTPLLAWLTAGCLKFAINSLKAGKPAFGLIGYGGLPSNHSAIVSSMAALIAFKEGIGHPAFGVALTLAFIVMLDANSLRRQVGKHAEAINRLNRNDRNDRNGRNGLHQEEATPSLRERMGHTRVEIGAGIVTGIAVAWLVQILMPVQG